ncbi:MAG: hypothetical protein ABJN14_09780 [Paracoccaceae bacterium]
MYHAAIDAIGPYQTFAAPQIKLGRFPEADIGTAARHFDLPEVCNAGLFGHLRQMHQCPLLEYSDDLN